MRKIISVVRIEHLTCSFPVQAATQPSREGPGPYLLHRRGSLQGPRLQGVRGQETRMHGGRGMEARIQGPMGQEARGWLTLPRKEGGGPQGRETLLHRRDSLPLSRGSYSQV